MSEPFGGVYAGAYDWLYGDKDYAAECALLARIFQTYGRGEVRSVLDLGCGTGNHAIPLARQGLEVVGVDRSAEMLSHAQSKAATTEMAGSLSLVQGDVRELDLGRRFDAVLMMFAVLGYQVENADVLAALRTVRRHLAPAGLFVFDVWYGPAVLRERPSQRIKLIDTPEGKILRAVSAQLDSRQHTCAVTYHLWRREGDRVVGETEETHLMRYFFPKELELLLQFTGLDLARLGAFPEFDREPDESDWNVLGVCRAN